MPFVRGGLASENQVKCRGRQSKLEQPLWTWPFIFRVLPELQFLCVATADPRLPLSITERKARKTRIIISRCIAALPCICILQTWRAAMEAALITASGGRYRGATHAFSRHSGVSSAADASSQRFL